MGCPSKRANPGWRSKDSPGLQAKFTDRVTLQPGTTQCAIEGSGNNENVNSGRRLNPTRSVYKRKT